MANKHMKRYAFSLIIRKLQIKTAVGQYYTFNRMGKDIPSASKDVGKYSCTVTNCCNHIGKVFGTIF